jgi:hypothetical protein
MDCKPNTDTSNLPCSSCESVALAGSLARLGRAAAAERMAGLVPAASARMAARITSRVVAAERLLRRRDADGRQSPAAADAALDELDVAAGLLLDGMASGQREIEIAAGLEAAALQLRRHDPNRLFDMAAQEGARLAAQREQQGAGASFDPADVRAAGTYGQEGLKAA